MSNLEALKRALKTRQITIENMKEQMGLVAVSTLKPEPIPLQVKVILVGNEFLHQLLMNMMRISKSSLNKSGF